MTLRRILLGVTLIAGTSPAWGAAPKVTSFFPAGAGRGQSVSVTATGEFSTWPVQVWVDRPGVTVEPEKTKGKLKVTVAEDVEPGTLWLRLFDKEGSTSLRPFVIGLAKEIEEKEPNDGPDKAPTIEGPVTINGRLAKGDVDAFIVNLQKGQTLVASVQANAELGSPMDAVLQVCALVVDPNPISPVAKEGMSARYKEAYVLEHNDDTQGMDPRIVFEAPHDGAFLVRLFAFPQVASSSISFAGGDDFIYRLSLTTGGFLDHAFPLAVTRDQSLDIQLAGWNIVNPEFRLPAELKPQSAGNNALSTSSPKEKRLFREDLSGTLTLPIVDHANVIAQKRTSVHDMQPITLPSTITGRLEAPRDQHVFSFMAKKGQRVRVTVEARQLGFELDPIISISTSDGKKVIEADDSTDKQNRDPDITTPIAADGQYRLSIRDTHQHGGFRYVYRMSVTAVRPDFTLTLKEDSFAIAAGKTLEIPVTVNRLDLLKDDVEVSVEGLPEGLSAAAVVSESKGASAKAVKLVLKSDAKSTAPYQGIIRIVGQSKTDATLTHDASFTATSRNAPNTLVWLTVTK